MSATARWVDWGATTSKSVITASEAKLRRRRSEEAARADQAESLELREDSGRTKRRSSRSEEDVNFEMRGREVRRVETVEGLCGTEMVSHGKVRKGWGAEREIPFAGRT